MFRRQNIKTINYVFGFRRNLTIENWEQVQKFPQLVIKFILENIKTDTWLRVRISAGRALKERQCTLKGQAWYVNVRSSVHWKGVYRVGQVHKFPHMGKFMHLIRELRR